MSKENDERIRVIYLRTDGLQATHGFRDSQRGAIAMTKTTGLEYKYWLEHPSKPATITENGEVDFAKPIPVGSPMPVKKTLCGFVGGGGLLFHPKEKG